MNSPRQTEMDKLRAIQSQLHAVTDRIATRLPTQRGHLVALVCARKWRLATLSKICPQTLTQKSMDAIAKKTRMEIGAFEYSTKEQSELLTRALFQLDDILSHGDAEIKETRKALVLSIQAQLERADALKESAAKLKDFTERIIASFPRAVFEEKVMNGAEESVMTEPEAETASPSDDTMEMTEPEAESASDDKMTTVEEASGNELRALFDEDETEEDVKQDDDETMDDASDDEGEQEEQEEEEEEEQEEEEQEEEDKDSFDLRSLPVWRPYYQIQQRADGVYIQANLHGVDPRHIRVEVMPQNGVVRITGFKLPTQKDLILSRLSGKPTFGRFEIVERFPTNQLSLDHATQQLTQDGTLQVRLPFYIIQRPRFVRRVSPFQPHRLAVW